jgi:hypothetical protein
VFQRGAVSLFGKGGKTLEPTTGAEPLEFKNPYKNSGFREAGLRSGRLGVGGSNPLAPTSPVRRGFFHFTVSRQRHENRTKAGINQE